ncbi:hypothetical protein GLF_0276 [Gluconobacter frateurii NBRC 101659]|nr:hypothetical protein GLF_0276 [Gluconobacter frateurii NBRC 101659]
MNIFRETERVPQEDARRQGDIIKFEWPEGTEGPPLGILINADCDLEHGKTDGVVAFVPMYSFKEYLEKFWVSGHIEEIIKSCTNNILKSLNSNTIDNGLLYSWLEEKGPEFVLNSLSDSAKFKKKSKEQIKKDIDKLYICIKYKINPSECFKMLCENDENPNRYARNNITNAKKNMGDGHFFINEIVDNRNVGFVVRMRRIYTIQETDFFLSAREQRAHSGGNKETAVRISRLTDIYRFKLLQLFAYQYSRVGLSDEITSLESLAVDDLIFQLVGEKK